LNLEILLTLFVVTKFKPYIILLSGI